MVTHDAKYYVDRYLERIENKSDVPDLDSILGCYFDWLGSDSYSALSESDP